MKQSVLLLGVLVAGQAVASVDFGLIAHFPLDGNARDVGEANREGVEHGVVSYARGKADQALVLNGEGGYVISPGHLNSYPELTISFWMNPAEDRDMMPYSAACGDDGDGGVGFSYSVDGEISFSVGKSINCFSHFGASRVSQKLDGPDRWYHVVGVYKARESLTLYVNGEKVDEETSGVSQVYLSNYQFIGTDLRAPGIDNNWYGDLDEVRVYNRALDETEIEELYMVAVGDCASPKAPQIAENLDMYIPLATYDGSMRKEYLWVDLEFVGDVETGEMVWRLREYQNVDECGGLLE